MRRLLPLLIACSNAATPGGDANPTVHDAPPGTDGSSSGSDASSVDAADLRILVVNEVAAGENPDWFEIINATTSPVELSDFLFVDKAGDFTKAVTLPQMTLAPGAFYAQDVSKAANGFGLGSDEELWVYRASDHALSDGVDWAAGDSPTGSSYARIPDTFGAFQTTTHQTKGAPNQP